MTALTQSMLRGLSFGFISGIITTLGLLVGLASSTRDVKSVLAGIIVISFADALSDSLGMFVSEESQTKHTVHTMMQSGTAAFLTKMLVGLSFTLWFFLFSFTIAVFMAVCWGLVLASIFSFFLAKRQIQNPWKMILFHMVLIVIVTVVSYSIGEIVYTII